MTWWQRCFDEDGSALVEVALALPVIIVILAGTVDFGLYEERKMQVIEAANAAAEYGAQAGNQLNASGMQSAALAASPSLTGLNVTATAIWMCTAGGTQVTNTTDCGSGATPLQYVLVKTSAVVSAPMPLGSLGSSMTVAGQTTYRVRWKPS